jgi:endonuclease III-like uncharacterized protein
MDQWKTQAENWNNVRQVLANIASDTLATNRAIANMEAAENASELQSRMANTKAASDWMHRFSQQFTNSIKR